jgi:acetolactate decarboxylase
MKSGISRGAVLLLVTLLGACGTAGADPSPLPAPQATQTIWQLSAFDFLLQGHYDGLVPAGEVKRHGNLGLGAADRLAGEMILVDGRFYRFAENGRAETPPDAMRMPFAEVTAWNGGTDVTVPAGAGYARLKSAIDARVDTLNGFYAVRVEGMWDSVRARTYKPQTKRPDGRYPPLDSAASDTVLLMNVRGVMVGFRQPHYAPGLGAPDYHLHFITEDRTQGGHVISFGTTSARAQVSHRPGFTLSMPAPPAAP